MTFKKGQWVKINETGEIGKILNIFDASTNYDTPFDLSCKYFSDSDLSPVPKTLDTLEVGDVLVDEYDNERTVLAIVGDCVFVSFSYELRGGAYFYTVQGIKDRGWKVKEATQEPKEYTMEEIAKSLGVKVEELKIKK